MRSRIVVFTGLFATLAFLAPARARTLPMIPDSLANPSIDLGGPPLWEGRIAWGEVHAVLLQTQKPIRPVQTLPPSLAPSPPPLASGRPYLKWYKKRFAAGEDVQFSVGFKPDPGWGYGDIDLNSMRLTVESPDGTRQTAGNNTIYEGGLPREGWLQPRTLPKASLGKYILEYRVGFPYTTGKVPIQVETLPPLEQIKIGFEWPKTGEITRKDALPVAFKVQNNSDQTIRFPVRRGAPDSTGWNVVRLAVFRNEPAAESGAWTDEALKPPKSTRVEMADYPAAPMRQASTWPSIVLKPGETYRQEISLHDVMDRLPGSVWREGAFRIQIWTTVDLLIGESKGPWAAFNPVHLEVSETKDFKLVAKPTAPSPFADVPRDHWAYGCVSLFARHGIVIGYPDGTCGGKRVMTRYEFAVAVARVLLPVANSLKHPDLYPMPTSGGYPLAPDDLGCLKRLIVEFRPELEMLKADLDVDAAAAVLFKNERNAATQP